MSTTALELNKQLHIQMGDYLEVQTTQLLSVNANMTSNALLQWDDGRDNYFQNWWLFVTDGQNAGKDRKIRNSYAANSTCNVFGAVWTTDTVVANVRLSRYSYTDAQRALNDAAKEVYPVLHKQVDDRASIATNALLYEYSLPSYFQTGQVKQVLVNTYGTASDYSWSRIYGWEIVNAGTSIRLPNLYTSNSQIRLIGITPLETVTNTTDAVNVDAPRLNLLMAYAKYKLYQMTEQPVASQDTKRYETESMKAYNEYLRLKSKLGMSPQTGTMDMRIY